MKPQSDEAKGIGDSLLEFLVKKAEKLELRPILLS